MKFHESSAPLDRDDEDSFPPLPAADDATEAVPDGAVETFDFEPDDDLLEPELGEHDGFLEDAYDLEENDADDPCDEDDDEAEMVLLREFGIDLDAPDETDEDVSVSAQFAHDDPNDDEAAA